MLNMLFISDSPKAVYLKSFLQPMLKVIIDVVTDFDQGLKDVFEKRPNTVFIQEQIGGVTGESVASHIQMLLGVGAPKFILLHEGNSKVRTSRGLFEHLVDLNQPDDVLAEEIQKNLKELLGGQWYKIYSPPTSAASEAAVTPSAALPETFDTSDTVFDDLLEDTKLPEAVREKAPAVSIELPEATFAQSAAEEYADLMPAPAVKPPTAQKPPTSQTSHKPQTSPTGLKPQAQSSPAGFRIRQDSPPEEELIPDELLLAFEQNYRPPSLFLKQSTLLIALAVVLCGAAVWYAVWYKPQLAASLTARFKPADAQRVAAPPVKTAPAEQAAPQPQSPPAVAVPVQAPAEKPAPKALLPHSIPQEGRDAAYAAGHPGWERYVGPQAEFRTYSKNGDLKALQVMARKGSKLSEAFIREVTGEFVGSPEYLISSREKKNGVLVLNGSIPQRGDIRIYKKNGAVRAFVVSRN